MASTKTAIYTALGANLAIAVTKFIAAGVTGSSAMVSEGIHSLVDTLNEVLLLLGMNRSQKPADEKRPFGYGRELYFWSYVVSVLIFAVGGGVSFYEGITHWQHPNPIENAQWNYIVLGIAIVLDTTSLVTAVKAFNAQRGSQPFWSAVKTSKDPATFVVLFEDASDVIGLVLAFLGVFLGHQLNNPYLDGAASILIGLLLTAVSILLARESRSLLMGEGADPAIVQKTAALTEADPDVMTLLQTLTFQMGPEQIVLIQRVVFQPDLKTEAIAEGITRLRQTLQAAEPTIRQVFIEPARLPDPV
ncbi:cation diffusion facilitator family transporter [Larkinella arboricola]|uniref:Cation diffusion facilitator family transporter n=1 Tax=Larkinella arboricola TaxID=643671 RepID=A0A327X2E6_LARAB|nr:cation diffusion facilitator family transporter [Larkinella arboricola]RAK00556.1 cation diffusion facilitator family transporter [Larkinella arboricola]